LQANKAAIKAMIVNRIGDFGLAMGLFTIFTIFQSLDYSIINSSASLFYNTSFYIESFSFDSLTLACIFLFIGAVGKSAQIGLHT
jgi:NADH:ubiquinone oxidoreductase subunit 5 (subunit L)/multisubunit Na+/H+ antiporter MnhA subunit